MEQLYYTAPTDTAFEEMKKACIEVWGQYKESPGNYYEEKLSRIQDITNIKDNFVYMFAMFDVGNQRKVVALLSESTKEELKVRQGCAGEKRDGVVKSRFYQECSDKYNNA